MMGAVAQTVSSRFYVVRSGHRLSIGTWHACNLVVILPGSQFLRYHMIIFVPVHILGLYKLQSKLRETTFACVCMQWWSD